MSMHTSIAEITVIVLALATLPAIAQDRETGLVFADEQSYRSIPLAATPLLGEIPDFVDLSGRFPTPGDQGQQGSCVGWAVAYALKSYQEQVERNWGLDTNVHRFSPAYIYNQIHLNDCNGGSLYIDAFNLLRRDGALPLSEFAYTDQACNRKPTEAERQRARLYAIADWRRVNVQDEVEVKTQIAAGFPVLLGMIVDTNFLELRKNTYERFSSEDLGGHALVVLGYSDERRAFKVINSWGTGWGDRGYGWISYSAFRRVSREGYVAQDIVNVPPPHPPSSDEDDTQPPDPQPPVSTPKAELGQVYIQHNVQVPTPAPPGSGVGMQIHVPGSIRNSAGRAIQLVVKFNYLNGPPLFANPSEPKFRDTGGLVATGTQARTVGSDFEKLSDIPITIPYYALNFQPTGGSRTWSLSLTVLVYLDNQVIATSAQVPFNLQW